MKKSFIALAFGTLGLGMSEFAMMAILPDIARSVNISIPQAGHFISVYALGVCVGAPLFAIVARKRPLKQILMALILVYVIGNLSFAFCNTYWMLLVTRFIAGLPHGAYFGVGSIIADKLADKGKGTAAVAAMVSGMTIANLVGVPLGTFLSHNFSWNVTYALIGLLGIAIMFAVRYWVPVLAALPDTGLKGQFKFLKYREPWLLIFATMLANGGIFCWYSYVNPLMTDVSGFTAADMTGIMMCAGLGMVLGNLVSGHLSDRFTPERTATAIQGIVCIALVLIFYFAYSPWMSVGLMFMCTMCLFGLSAPEQILLLRNSKGGELLGAAMVQVAFNLGNAIGAYSGGVAIDRNYGYESTALVGAGFAFIGFLLFFYFCIYSNKKQAALR